MTPEANEPTFEQHAAAYVRAMRAGDVDAAALIKAEMDRVLPVEAGKRTAAEMNLPEKLWTSFGGGVNSFLDAAGQITRIGQPKTAEARDAALRATRERDKALTESTNLDIAPDWVPNLGEVAFATGESLPAFAVPAGPATGLAARALARGGPVLTRTMAGLTGGPIRAGMTAGGISGALHPVTSEESRGMNVALSTAGGGLLPGIFQGGRRAYHAFGGNAPERAGQNFVRDLGEQEATNAAGAARTYFPTGAEDIPVSTAAATQNPRLGMMERASRKQADQWLPFDIDQNEAVWQNVQRATENAPQLGPLRQARSAAWREREGAALANLRPRNWNRELAQFQQDIAQAATSPAGQNQMRGVIAEIQRQMADLGPDFGPQHLAALRSRMSGAIRGTDPADPFTSASKTDPFYISLRDEMDRILNSATGGRWQSVPQGFARESVPVNAAEASQGIRNIFITPEGSFLKKALGNAPTVTEAQLGTAIARGGENRFGDMLAPASRQRLEATLEALRAQSLPQRLRTTGTSGGGSDTVMNALNAVRNRAAAGEDVGGLINRGITMAIDWAMARGDRRLTQELTQALQDPQRFVQLIEIAQRANRPLTPAQQAALAALASSVGGGAATTLQPPQ